jgi:hypothetical protein
LALAVSQVNTQNFPPTHYVMFRCRWGSRFMALIQSTFNLQVQAILCYFRWENIAHALGRVHATNAIAFDRSWSGRLVLAISKSTSTSSTIHFGIRRDYSFTRVTRSVCYPDQSRRRSGTSIGSSTNCNYSYHQ